jgi:hypothetical protein
MIRSELLRLHGISLSLATIHKVLKRNQVMPLTRYQRLNKKPKRYSRAIPVERVQTDVCKIATGLYQYSAVDDCTRYKVPALYQQKTAVNSKMFLEKAVEEMPLPFSESRLIVGVSFSAFFSPGASLGMGYQVSPDQTSLTPPKRQGRAFSTD